MRKWGCVTCMSCTEGVNLTLRTCTFACFCEQVCEWVGVSFCATIVTASESILVATGMASSVVSCVSVRSRRLRLAVSGALQSHLSSFPVRMTGLHTKLSRRHSLQPTAELINSANLLHSLSKPWIIIPLYKTDSTTKHSHQFCSIFFLCGPSSFLDCKMLHRADIPVYITSMGLNTALNPWVELKNQSFYFKVIKRINKQDLLVKNGFIWALVELSIPSAEDIILEVGSLGQTLTLSWAKFSSFFLY